jgi:hypothetical protein
MPEQVITDLANDREKRTYATACGAGVCRLVLALLPENTIKTIKRGVLKRRLLTGNALLVVISRVFVNKAFCGYC